VELAFRWNKILIAAMAISGFLSVAVVAPLLMDRLQEYREAQLHPRPASDSEQSEILRGVLGDDFYKFYMPLCRPRDASPTPSCMPPKVPGEVPAASATTSIVLIDTSIASCKRQPAVKEQSKCISDRDADLAKEFVLDEPGIPKKLLQELMVSNQISSTVADPHIAAVLLQPRSAIEALIDSADRWSQFDERFPNSRYAIEVSRAVLSEDRTHALIYVQLLFIPNGEQGVLYYLARRETSWRIERVSGPSIM
jgi:hypothetical protein